MYKSLVLDNAQVLVDMPLNKRNSRTKGLNNHSPVFRIAYDFFVLIPYQHLWVIYKANVGRPARTYIQ